MENLIWANLRIITQEMFFQKAPRSPLPCPWEVKAQLYSVGDKWCIDSWHNPDPQVQEVVGNRDPLQD